ncbi:MAG: hypothetical protein NZV14_03075 [Bryobacteraceae bacterium]|nr:hypothetical protein [Bryobacteraceae bacterium]MDW8377117.1 hypothetical protein [Bryobacterales bacterium]
MAFTLGRAAAVVKGDAGGQIRQMLEVQLRSQHGPSGIQRGRVLAERPAHLPSLRIEARSVPLIDLDLRIQHAKREPFRTLL